LWVFSFVSSLPSFAAENKMNKKKHTSKAAERRHRNFVALAALRRSGAGRHTDRKKEASKRACRKKVEE
jgi:hypothetical protein